MVSFKICTFLFNDNAIHFNIYNIFFRTQDLSFCHFFQLSLNEQESNEF